MQEEAFGEIEERRGQTFMNRLCRTTLPFALALPIFLPFFLSLRIFLVWLGVGEFVSVSNLHELQVWTLPLIYVQLFTLKPYSVLWKHCMCFRTLRCQCQWSTAQRKRTCVFKRPERDATGCICYYSPLWQCGQQHGLELWYLAYRVHLFGVCDIPLPILRLGDASLMAKSWYFARLMATVDYFYGFHFCFCFFHRVHLDSC